MKVIYESDINAITLFSSSIFCKVKKCVVFFSALHEKKLLSKPGGSDVFLKKGIDVIAIQSKIQDWHQSIPKDEYNNLSKILKDKYLLRFGYGISMGGYAALLFARQLDFCRVIALCPQYTITENFDMRWSVKASKIKWNYSMDYASMFKGEIFIAYDPIDLDKEHFFLFKNKFIFSRVFGIPVKFSSHHLPKVLNETKLLNKTITETLIEGKLPNLKINFKESKTLLREKSFYLAKNPKKLNSALILGLKSISLGEENPKLYRHLSNVFVRMDEIKKAREFAKKACDATDNNKESKINHLIHLAYLQKRLGELDDALITIDELTKRDPNLPNVFTLQSFIFLEKENFIAAKDAGHKAILLGDERHSTYRHLSNVFVRMDEIKKAREFAKKACDATDNNKESKINHLKHLAYLQKRLV